MKKLLSMIMLGIFLSSLTFAFAQAPAADKKADTKEAAPKKEKKAAKSKGAKKEKKEAAPAAK